MDILREVGNRFMDGVLGGSPFKGSTPGGCMAAITVVFLGTLVLALVGWYWLFGGDDPLADEDADAPPQSKAAASVESGADVPVGTSAATILIPTSGRWEVENFAFVEGCGPSSLGAGSQDGRMIVSEDGTTIRAIPYDPESATLDLERIDVGPNHAHYKVIMVGFLVIEFHFDRPDHMDAYAWAYAEDDKGSICVLRPAEGNLVAPFTAGDTENEDPDDEDGDNGSSGNPSIAGGSSQGSDPDLSSPDFPDPGEMTMDLAGDNLRFTNSGDCNVTSDSFLVSGRLFSGSNQVDLTASGNLIGDRWAIGITAVTSESRFTITSQGDAVDPPIIDGSRLLLTADFIRYVGDDLDNAEALGTGRVAANCE